MADPFNLSQYISSLNSNSSYLPETFAFADFPSIFSMLSEQIRMRQAAIQVGYGVSANEFINVEHYDTNTPTNLAETIVLFQQAVEQMVNSSLLTTYALLPGCPNVYTGFFFYPTNGLPIIGIQDLLQQGGWIEPPDPLVTTSRIDFARLVGENVNEIIRALNVLVFIHGPMTLSYPYDSDCQP